MELDFVAHVRDQVRTLLKIRCEREIPPAGQKPSFGAKLFRGDIRMTVVGSPAYFARRSKPTHPRDLIEHECLNWHPTPDAPPYKWEFTEPRAKGNSSAGRDIVVAARGRVVATDSAVNIRLARDGYIRE